MDSNRLFCIREDNDLTQRDIAKILNVGPSNISRWEKGTEIIPLPKLNMYANYFNINLDYLLNLSDKKKHFNSTFELDNKKIGEKLRFFRKQNKITQVELANFLNTSHSTINAYEAGKTLILTAFAYQICKKYNLSLDWLCCRSNVMHTKKASSREK